MPGGSVIESGLTHTFYKRRGNTMSKITSRGALLLATLACLGGQVQAANLAYTFDTDAQGVTVTGANVTATDGHLVLKDIDENFVIAWLPTQDLGDWSRFLGGTLSFDAINVNGAINDELSFGTLRIESGATVIERDLIVAPAPASDWTTYSIRLDEAGFGPELASLLANVTRVGLTLESHNGFDATNGGWELNGLDNLRVTAVPEPQGWALMATGLVALGAASRRRRPQR